MSARTDSRAHAYDDQNRHAGFVYVLMLVVALAFGGFLWQLYSAPDGERVTAPPSPPSVETAPMTAPDPSELSADNVEEEALPVEELAADAEALSGPPQLAPLPAFAADGRYAVQLAALQNEASATRAWERLSSRAPGLFANAQLDIERADLGPRGIFYRLRAGYFADRDNAARFCQRLRQMGQDCIAVAR